MWRCFSAQGAIRGCSSLSVSPFSHLYCLLLSKTRSQVRASGFLVYVHQERRRDSFASRNRISALLFNVIGLTQGLCALHNITHADCLRVTHKRGMAITYPDSCDLSRRGVNTWTKWVFWERKKGKRILHCQITMSTTRSCIPYEKITWGYTPRKWKRSSGGRMTHKSKKNGEQRN